MAKENISSVNKTLVNADYINLLWKNVNVLRNNTKICSQASKEVALEVNIDTIKYSFIHSSMALEYFVGHWSIFQVPNLLHSQKDSLHEGSVRSKAAMYTQNSTNT